MEKPYHKYLYEVQQNTWILEEKLNCSPQDVKEAAYKGLVRPVLEYGSSLWGPHTKGLQEELEKVQNRAARFVTRNYTFEEERMTGLLEQFNWESLKKRRTDNRLILLYKGLKPWHFTYHLLVQRNINVVSFPRLSGTGMISPTLCFPPPS